MTLDQIARAVGGTVHDGDPNARVDGAATVDSRTIEPGGLFVALAGSRTDGHDFAAAAAAAGGAAALTVRPVGVPAIVVDDVLLAFGRLAAAVVDQVPGLVAFGVTGSVGKTTTKDLLGQLLTGCGPTVAPAGNRNNEIGVPETVCRLTSGSRFLVAEMGARHRGDIAHLCALVRPRVGIVLNVGTAHLGEFGSREAIAHTKGELVEALPSNGLAVLNGDDPLVAAMAGRTAAATVTFGLTAAADITADTIEMNSAGEPSFQLRTQSGSAPVRLQLHGEHLIPNALAAAAATFHVTDDVDAVAAGLSAAVPVSAGRMRVTHRCDGITIVDDSYNASPPAMAAALLALRSMATGRRAVAVLGEMYELGEAAGAEHTTVGELAARAGVQALIAVGGNNARRIADAAVARGIEVVHVPDRDAAMPAVCEVLRPGDVALIKGSNGVGLQAVAAALTDAAASSGGNLSARR
ncbi:UDP-N-acetylmuramoyl-tripeptide--D-alanyl-D-alanine ligase [Paractinoplanes rishiriensis]|uniref:UDP-N-acetylmuramoyl-tripeptide--D-alanyl-D-alanine ligase n=1 Tax=Paractinoplanes rishiriensis TaxID=1050105 RepID=A0A919K7M2_9ACTN|nr:UDP-N-acetylmuramoyl-tripeptide--D-alanyl-D-alanine ligase [Actinoplanes rishiriensis]GIF01564.1 UDP-N-acetylmuramoyl-tripeptide--D-alanyl-D-alanine ligase [Actinoplanes rishiriensis]